MKRKCIISCLLAVFMVLSLLPGTAFAVEEKAAATAAEISDGVNLLSLAVNSNSTPSTAAALEMGNAVHASSATGGKEFQSAPVWWYVMGSEGDGTVTLMSKFSLAPYYFKYMSGNVSGWAPGVYNRYSDSDLKTYLNGTLYPGMFSASEKTLVAPALVRTGVYRDYMGGGVEQLENVWHVIGNELSEDAHGNGGYPLQDANQYLFPPWGHNYITEDNNGDMVKYNLAMYWSTGSTVSSAYLVPSQLRAGIFRTSTGEYEDTWLRNPNFYEGTYPGTSAGTVYSLITSNGDESRLGSDRVADDEIALRLLFKLDPDNIVNLESVSGSGYTVYKPVVFNASVGGVTGLPETAKIDSGGTISLTGLSAGNQGNGYSVGYKLVGGASGARSIVRSGKQPASSFSALSIPTGAEGGTALDDGIYDLYVWLQLDNASSANEAGTVYKIPVTIGGDAPPPSQSDDPLPTPSESDDPLPTPSESGDPTPLPSESGEPTPVAQDGWKKEGSTWYFYENGAKKTGWLKDGEDWYYTGENGAMKTGWLDDGGTWYFLNSGGDMAAGWHQVNGVWNEFRSGGQWVAERKSNTGWRQYGTRWAFQTNGTWAYDWKLINGEWYYFNTSGYMVTGWQKVGANWYYLKSSGAMATGWQQVGRTWYYLKPSGAMATGWLQLGSTWYYLNSSGDMRTGWLEDPRGSKIWYWLKGSGAMAANETVNIGGKAYRFGEGGIWIN